MTSQPSAITSFEIKYETESSIPAPYAHFYHIQAAFKANGELHVKYQLQYLDRVSLSEEEIIDEGFTLNDDFSWEGSLPAVWKAEMQLLLSHTKLLPLKDTDDEPYFALQLTEAPNTLQEGTPHNRSHWEYAAQELTQAIFEMAQREMPLHLQYKKIHSDGTFDKLSFTVRFSTRQITITQESGKGSVQERIVEWSQLKELLRMIYIPEYLYENATTKEPRQPGIFIDNGEGLWYQFGESVHNPSKKRDILAEIENLMDALIQK